MVGKSGKKVYEGEYNGGGEDLTSESDAAGLPTKMEQKPKITRKTRDRGDSQEMDHALTSEQGKK